MRRPAARGPVSAALLEALVHRPGPVAEVHIAEVHVAVDEVLSRGRRPPTEVLDDEDLQVSLFLLYELHYRGVDGVDDAWEWSPDLLGCRAALEGVLEGAIREMVPVPAGEPCTASEVAALLFALTAADDGPSVSSFVAKKATDEQLRELVMHRSVYQLKEADPHTWALPRLSGRPKSALIEVQADEYGNGRPGHAHAEIFAGLMRAMGLDDSYGAYLDVVPASTLAPVNMMSLFGLHRRLRGAITGHLAAFEMTSSIPSRRYANGLRRLGYGPEVTHYYDEHVEADAVHEQIAGRDLAGGLVEMEPQLRDDVLWGAAACLAVDGHAGARMLDAWHQGRSALRQPRDLAA